MGLNRIFIRHSKNTENMPSEKFLPQKVKIPLSQGMGAPNAPLVSVDEEVFVGQKIGGSDAAFSCPIHSSVSGKVTGFSEYLTSNGAVVKCVDIESDGKFTPHPDIKPSQVTNREEFIAAVKASGLVGLGGAGFPTHIKLNYNPDETPVDTLIINAAECEPYITSDYREMIENTDGVLDGVRTVLKMLGIEKAIIAVEDNKPQAIKMLREKTEGESNISIFPLRSSYPQGAEKVIIYNTVKRVVKEGELPSSVGVVVMNVSSAAFINSYLKTGMPLVSKRITVDGETVSEPKNLIVPIGTVVDDLLKFCKTDEEKTKRLILGGMMMGQCAHDSFLPITKTNNAVLAFREQRKDKQTACIRCASCINACPLGLMPCEIEKAYKSGDLDALKALKVNLCMNCGSCTYICPAKRDLAETNQLAKRLLMPKNKG
ncbi:MAG: electron transport complex subunit RsxC [Ruminococcus sp.]|nr:electron transport complex subunit RsxC [Ruminococcus sp.]